LTNLADFSLVNSMTYYPVIGLEIHVQLNTTTKLFCSCLNEYAPDEPNKNICPFCTGQPGALPLLNKAAVKKALVLGVAVNGNIPKQTRWDRKNYFYPDLPAGYQISQYDNPIIEGGVINFLVEDEGGKTYRRDSVNLTRAHLEADAGKLLHVGQKSLVDYNRSGCPLIEIVTEPELNNADQAMAFVEELQLLVRTLGISDADMEKGQMRFDCNLSLRTEEQERTGELPGYKVEVKNINSFRSLGRAIEFEIERQTKLLDEGQKPSQETRGWRDDLNKSTSQRSKEEAQDYRYFPEPDLRILTIRPEDIPDLADLPELPQVKREKYLDLGLSLQVANLFVKNPDLGELFERSVETKDDSKLVTTIANILTSNVIAIATKTNTLPQQVLSDKQLRELADLFVEDKISNQSLSQVVDVMAGKPGESVEEYVKKNGLIQVTDDSALQPIVDQVIEDNPGPVGEYREGKVQVIGFLIGQCMKQSKGQGNPKKFKDLLEKSL
jgi:aspartyl-tRNA(Asn)/glutamyl-tRNA(Gln) amidotransferase subunit B